MLKRSSLRCGALLGGVLPPAIFALTTLLAMLLATPSFAAAPPVVVVVGKDAPELEQFAASELAAQFRRLFEVDVSIENSSRTIAAQKSSAVVYIGRPATNPAIKALTLKQQGVDIWPRLSDQGLVLRSIGVDGKPGLIVGGGSPKATLWSVYELGRRFGVRYLLREDIYPDAPQAFDLSGMAVVQEPELRTRTWRTINDFAIGAESWPLADHKRLLGQLAKMKFNRLMLSIYPWQPFVHYEVRGVAKQTGMLWFGEEYPIPRDAPGRTALRGVVTGERALFTNPDFAGKNTYEEMTQAGVAHASGIMAEAQRLGMSVGISISPLEFPREFAKLLGGTQARGINGLVTAPGAKQKFNDPLLKEMVAAKIRAYLQTYPQVDSLYLTLPEFPDWDADLDQAWAALTPRLGAGAPQLSTLLKAAAERRLFANGQRGVNSLKGNVVALAFLNELFQDSSLLERPDGRRVALILTAIDPELFPYLDKILPADAGTLHFIDYTARRVAENQEYLLRVPADKVRSSLILTLADDNVGVLSQATTRRLESLVKALRKNNWEGFSTRYWMLAELDPAVHYLSLASWDEQTTARSAHDDLFTIITGKQSISDRLWRGFGQIEQATELIDQNNLGFGFPVPGMLMKHYQPTPAPKWLDELNEHYTQAMIEFYRSHGAAHPRSQRLLFYWAKRSEYVLEYLAAVKEVREAAIARQQGDADQTLEHFETAIEQLYNALDTLSDIAHDQSDRGLIAVLNAYAYRPLLAELEKVEAEQE